MLLADEAEQKSSIHLHEAVAIATWGGAPNAAIHSAYYAMHFCAVAALYRAGGVGRRGDVPQSHEHVLLHYIKLTETNDHPFIRESGRLLNRARDDRMRADYFVGMSGQGRSELQGASTDEATEMAELANQLLSAWRERWNERQSNRRLPESHMPTR